MAAPENYSVKTLRNFVGHDFGVSPPMKVDQIRINIFADVTGDHQWIHVDVEKAKKFSPFGGPVAHGFLTLSLLASALASLGVAPPDAMGAINYGLEKVRFLAPVPAGAEIVASTKLIGVEEKGEGRQLIRLETSASVVGSEKPSVVGEMLVMIVG